MVNSHSGSVKQRFWIGLQLAIVTALIPAVSFADPTSQPSDSFELVKQLNQDAIAFAGAFASVGDLSDSAAREKLSPTVLPLIHHAISVIDQMPANCKGQSMDAMKNDWDIWLIVFNEATFVRNTKAAANGTGESAINAQIKLARAQMLIAATDVTKSETVARRVVDLAGKAPASDVATSALLSIELDERLPAETRDAATQLLQRSTSPVAVNLRLLRKMVTTRPAM